MPIQNLRTKALAQNGKMKTAGRMTVSYRNAAGKTFDALVVGGGTASGLKLVIRNPASATTPGSTVLDNVPVATTVKSLSSYTARGVQ
jgi:hypothetical protein